MQRTFIGLVGCLLLATLLTTPIAGQQTQTEGDRSGPEHHERFSGTVEVNTPSGPRSVHATLVNWIVPNRQRIDRLEVSGLTLIEVVSGEMTASLAGGKSTEYEEGSWLLVPAGASLAVETGDDSVALQTLSVTPEAVLQ